MFTNYNSIILIKSFLYFLVIGVGAGLLRVIYINKKNRAELVPVDLCVNSLIATAYDIAKTNNLYEEPPIFNFVTSDKSPITWEDYCDLCILNGVNVPLLQMAWYFTLTMSSSRLWVTFLTFWYHTVPAIIVDTILFLIGKKPK